MDLNIQIESVTCDGLSNIIKAIKKTCPHAIIQQCLAHIQRETLIWLTRNPQSMAGIELKTIIGRLHLISDKDNWGYWIVDLIHWYEKHKDFVNEKTYYPLTKRYWFTHKSVRKSFIHIKRALGKLIILFIRNTNYFWHGYLEAVNVIMPQCITPREVDIIFEVVCANPERDCNG